MPRRGASPSRRVELPGACTTAMAMKSPMVNGTTMPFPAWLAELRRLLAVEQPPKIDAGGWSDDDVRRYYDKGFSPESAAAELRFRELARS